MTIVALRPGQSLVLLEKVEHVLGAQLELEHRGDAPNEHTVVALVEKQVRHDHGRERLRVHDGAATEASVTRGDAWQMVPALPPREAHQINGWLKVDRDVSQTPLRDSLFSRLPLTL